MIRFLTCLMVAWALCPLSFSQTASPYTLEKLHRDLFASAAYLTSGEVDLYSIDHKVQFAGLMGREDLLGDVYDVWLDAECSDLVEGDPLETLLEATRDTRLVILNEAHMMPLHRGDSMGLIAALVEQGFTHYAYESFAPSITERKEAYIRTSDVFYSNDPVHARLLRELKAAGVKFIAYEGSGPDGREAAQAANLAELVFEADPEARLIVVAGWAHVYEHGEGFAGEMMARRLKEKTGIDPVTIQQTFCASSGSTPVLARATERPNPMADGSMTDYNLGHPRLSFTNGRPDWRRQRGDQDVPVPAELLSAPRPIIIEARRPDEPDLAVPEDRILLMPGESLPLLLPPGEYAVTGWTKAGPILQKAITVRVK
ncbi:MAG: hypothetical protein AAGB16_09310 [Pseudomonadota bacterium]